MMIKLKSIIIVIQSLCSSPKNYIFRIMNDSQRMMFSNAYSLTLRYRDPSMHSMDTRKGPAVSRSHWSKHRTVLYCKKNLPIWAGFWPMSCPCLDTFAQLSQGISQGQRFLVSIVCFVHTHKALGYPFRAF